MKTIILPALAGMAALSLGACSASDDTPEAAVTDAAMAADAEADGSAATTMTTTNTDAAAGTTATMDTTTPDSVTISEDGVNANINDGGTSVTADVDGDPSVTVTDR